MQPQPEAVRTVADTLTGETKPQSTVKVRRSGTSRWSYTLTSWLGLVPFLLFCLLFEILPAIIIIEGDIAVLFEDNAVYRERARLVRAQDIHRAQVLDRIEPLDDDLLARHQHGAFGETDAYDHR